MKIITQQIRPVGYCTLELSETEIQTIIGCIEELQQYKNRPMEDIGGIRQDIYIALKKILS